ncbi:hypothetical protein X943_000668 (apicoplast) [Babesia divergens]|uniref:DNA-directed RNA polymerase n=1 Tax=Babesia divergens TaxID=32595 RepID=A0AAD9G569_BABDI|nr:hypothetical protein X943_000668 [Babesia divergens]
MITYNKNLKLLTLINISYIEKYLKEIINLSFEYSFLFNFTYDLNSFKTLCLYNLNTNYNNLYNLFYLLNLYLEKDYFYSYLFSLINLKSKLNFNQLFQIIGIKGSSSFINNNNILLSNLYYSLSLKDYIYSSFTSRISIIDSGLNISESGYLTRKLIESLRNLYIKCVNCYTFYLYKNIFNNKNINIPFLCINNKSICLKCMNVNYNYFILSGYNKGVICGQALGEPSTQMLLRTFHLGDKLIFKNLFNFIYINKRNNKFKYLKYYRYFNMLYNIIKYINLIKFNINFIIKKYNIINLYININNNFNFYYLLNFLIIYGLLLFYIK